MKRLYGETFYSRVAFEELLKKLDLNTENTTKTKLAALYGAYRAKGLGPPIKYLVTDDAKNLAFWKRHQLCWVHEIRKYKLLDVYGHTNILDELLGQMRLFYRDLRLYRKSPNQNKKVNLEKEFDRVFKQETSLSSINKQLALTYKNKKKLLYVLSHPGVEIHNNQVERDIREKVIKRKISLFNRSMKGVRNWDLMLSLASTCRKNGISFYRYLIDRHGGKGEVPYLGKVILAS